MKRTELITLVKETLAEIFDSAKYVIRVTPTAKGNGAYICVKEIVNAEGYATRMGGTVKPWDEYYQVGYNKTVYAIAGKENVVKAIKSHYSKFVEQN